MTNAMHMLAAYLPLTGLGVAMVVHAVVTVIGGARHRRGA
jgi:hypothetical protein